MNVRSQIKPGIKRIQRHKPSAIRSSSNPRIAYLTFDDGPNEYTEQILDVLKAYDASATFFMLKPHILQHANTAMRIVREGHAVGLHGVTHRAELFYASKESVIEEFNDTRYTLRAVTGKDTQLVRTPYGSILHMKPSYFDEVERWGYLLWDWNVDSRDWKYRDDRSVRAVKRRVRALRRSGKDPVILMHDRPETAELLKDIIAYLYEHGYRLNKLDETLKPVRLKSI
ncbi:polysaccharide deacetylase family protein [Paenibacillus guangzhouensis]|uniref:polysaccharide deacetylase family protein n=1 Tax=Paenibacillus guangzhouensis TaxID=1473112 RepID=UPI001266FB7F|nr:polysaccharide deacetylase family protein [Paenibacillus guangzhouensis]